MNAKELIPKNKFDHETVERLKNLSYEELKPIMPDLLEWLQDFNWPLPTLSFKFLSLLPINLFQNLLKSSNLMTIYGSITFYNILDEK